MPIPPEITGRRFLNDTGIFRIEQLDLQFSNGAERQYQRVVGSDQGAVLVVPVNEDGELLLIREWAAGTQRYELGFAKGHIEDGEEMLAAANREIREETGFAARRLQHLYSMTVAPGYLYHTTHLVLAQDLYPARLPGDEPEPIEVVPWPLERLAELLQQPDFTEARSIAACFLVRDRLVQERSQGAGA